MDIVSHGLYGGVAFGRRSRASYWTAFLIGILPDLLSFGILTVLTALRLVSGPDWGDGVPNPAAVPMFVHRLYDVTHSLVVAALVIAFVWYVAGKRMVELFAWPLHILVDIPTHSSRFFPTPFLWPLSDFHVDGVSWGTPWVYYTNVAVLVVLYLHYYVTKRRRKVYGDER